MKELALILQLLSYMPAVQTTPKQAAGPRPTGTGTLLIASCTPGETVVAEPGHLSGSADKDGVARIKAPAQADQDDPYQINAGGAIFVMNGTLSSHESLSAVCP